MRRWKIQSKEGFQERLLHHLPHPFRMSWRHSHFLHQLVAGRQKRRQQPALHAPSIFCLYPERAVYSVLSLELLEMADGSERGSVHDLLVKVMASVAPDSIPTAQGRMRAIRSDEVAMDVEESIGSCDAGEQVKDRPVSRQRHRSRRRQLRHGA